MQRLFAHVVVGGRLWSSGDKAGRDKLVALAQAQRMA